MWQGFWVYGMMFWPICYRTSSEVRAYFERGANLLRTLYGRTSDEIRRRYTLIVVAIGVYPKGGEAPSHLTKTGGGLKRKYDIKQGTCYNTISAANILREFVGKFKYFI